MAASLVQARMNGLATGTTASVTLPGAPTAGNTIVCWISVGTNTIPSLPAGFTDISNGSSGAGGTTRAARLCYRVVVAGDSATISSTVPATVWEIIALEFSGLTSTPLQTGLQAATISTSQTGPSITPTASSNALLVGFHGERALAATADWTAPSIGGTTSTFAANITLNDTQTSGYGCAHYLEVASATGTYAPTATPPAQTTGSAGIAAFNVAAAGGGAPAFVPASKRLPRPVPPRARRTRGQIVPTQQAAASSPAVPWIAHTGRRPLRARARAGRVTAPAAAALGRYQYQVALDQPTVWWHLDEASGTTFADSGYLGAGHHAAITGGVTVGAGKLTPYDPNTSAAAFDGSVMSYAETGTSADFRPTNLSVECLFQAPRSGNPDGWTGNHRLVQYGPDNSWALYLENSQLKFTVFGHASAAVSYFNDGNRHHVVGTYDGVGGSTRLYVDGVEIASQVAGTTGAPSSTVDPLRIGQKPTGVTSGDGWPGTLDEVALYNVTLTASQVARHAAAAGLGTPPRSFTRFARRLPLRRFLPHGVTRLSPLQLVWKGYTWDLANRNVFSPYVNSFSPDQIVIDSSGNLRLRVNPTGGGNSVGAELAITQSLGYGTYSCVVGSEVDNMHPNVVWGGMFTYGNDAAYGHREIDANEQSMWSGATGPATLSQAVWMPSSAVDPYAARGGFNTAGRTVWRGVNSSGGEFGAIPGTYNTDYHYDSLASLQYLYGRGHRTVRLPFLWERVQPTLGAALDATELGRIRSFVADAGTAGLGVILDVHNYGAYNGNKIGSGLGPTTAQFTDLWTRLSVVFKNDTRVIGYGLMNEPNGLGTSLVNNLVSQTYSSWTPDDSACTVAGTTFGGDNVLQMTRNNANSFLNANAPVFNVTVGTTYTISADFYPTFGSSRIRLRIEWQDSGGTPLSTQFSSQPTASINTWTNLSYTATAPTSAAKAKLTVYSDDTTTIGNFTYVRNAYAGVPTPVWHQVSQAAVVAIRETSDAKLILVPGNEWSGVADWPLNNGATGWITDWRSNFLYEGHHYFDRDHSGAYANTYAAEVTDAIAVGWTAGSYADALTNRVMTEFNNWMTWLTTNGATGLVGEMGWPRNNGIHTADYTSWNTLGGTWYGLADTKNVGVTYWSTSEWWGTYSLSLYDVSAGVLATPNTQAATVEAHPQYVQPALAVTGASHTAVMIWEPTRVTLRVYTGTTPTRANLFREGFVNAGDIVTFNIESGGSYTGPATIPVPGDEKVHFNLWVCPNFSGTSDPATVTATEIILQDFAFTPLPGPVASFLRLATRRVGMTRRGKTTGTPRGQAAAPANPKITQLVSGRVTRIGRVLRRPRAAQPPVDQVGGVQPVTGRRRLGLRRKPTTTAPVQVQQAAPTNPAITTLVGVRARLATRALRRGKVANPTPAQQTPPTNPKITQLTTGLVRRLGRVSRRSRIVPQPVPPQFNPPFQFNADVRGLRKVAALWRRPRPVQAPLDQALVAAPGRVRRRLALRRRTVGVGPVPTQQAAPVNPAITMTVTRGLRRLGGLWRRAKTPSPVPPQQAVAANPAITQLTAGRARIVGRTLRRPEAAAPPLPQPAPVQSPTLRGRRLVARRARNVAPPPMQERVLPVPERRAPRPVPARKARGVTPVQAQAVPRQPVTERRLPRLVARVRRLVSPLLGGGAPASTAVSSIGSLGATASEVGATGGVYEAQSTAGSTGSGQTGGASETGSTGGADMTGSAQ